MKTVGSLFSGIGGLDLGLEWAGWQVVWQAETNPYACRILEKHWPDVPNLGDVTEIDWENVRRPDLVCAGFPCQPVSHAGARRGTDDDRWLWPEVERCVRVVRPGWVLLENVPGLLTLGFGQVATGLAELGYDFRWDCIPAAAVGAPHLRYRIFVVAHARGAGRQQEPGSVLEDAGSDVGAEECPRDHIANGDGQGGRAWTVADTDRRRSQGRPVLSERPGQRPARPGGLADTDSAARRPAWGAGETVLGSGTVERPGRRGSSSWDFWEFEPDVGRVAHGIPHRVDRLRCLGNAVVPQVAELVARMWLP